MRTNEKGLYHIVGTKVHTLYENNKIIGGGCNGKEEYYIMSNTIEEAISKINNMFKNDIGHDYIINGTIDGFNITSVKEIQYFDL